MSDWLESPLALLGAQEDGAQSAHPAPARSAERNGGAIKQALRRRPALSGFCAFLLLLVVVGTTLWLVDLEHRDRTGTGLVLPAQALTVLEPRANSLVSATTVLARCRTENGASVFINGVAAEAGSGGEFSRKVELAPGLNTLVFEAVDLAGNVIYNSLLVTRK